MNSAASQPLVADVEAVRATVGIIIAPGQVTEVRALDATSKGDRFPRTWSGYFDDMDRLAASVNGLLSARAVYLIPNPVNPALLARAANRLRPAGKGDSTADHDIVRRLWLKLDCDPVRPAGISSTDDEHAAALERLAGIVEDLANEGWPMPLEAQSLGVGDRHLLRADLSKLQNAIDYWQEKVDADNGTSGNGGVVYASFNNRF